MIRLILVATLSILAFAPAVAEERYALIERGDTIIRVDAETGHVSFCRNEGEKPVCKIAADERAAWMAEVDTLEKRINELQDQVGEMDGKSTKPTGKLSQKEKQDLDKALDVAETMIRRFFGIVKTLKRDLEPN